MKRKNADSATVKIKKKKSISEEKRVLSAEEREKRKGSIYRAPTNEELTELKENEDLYKNNLFRMQIQYLLEEVCLQESKLKKINSVLHSMNTFLKGLPVQKTSHEMSSEDVNPPGVKVPFPSLIPDSKIKGAFSFAPPKEVKVVGSFLLKTTIKANQCIDLAVEMPQVCLHSRDFLNYRYYYKRAIYLAWLASHLKGWEHTEELSYSCSCDVYKPVLNVKLKGKVGKKFTISLHTMIPEGVFKLVRYIPLKNNIRSNWYEGREEGATEELDFPTPHYNNGVLRDMLYENHLHTLYNALKECPGMKDAICLLKVWLKQRSFKGCMSFNGFCGSMLLVYLLSARKISAHMSSYQIFRLALHFITATDWTQEGISLCKSEDEKLPPLRDFHSAFDVVFVDPSGYMNLCADVDTTTYKMIRYQARLSLKLLDDSLADAFNGLFIKSQSFLQTVDHSFKLCNTSSFKEMCMKDETKSAKIMNHGGDWGRLLSQVISPVLTKGLGTRIHGLFLKPKEQLEWSVDDDVPDVTKLPIMFGICVNTEFSDNVLIMGPPADQSEAKEFRTFWGSKSELRRFQDGSINEAVLWQCNNITERSMVSKQIVEHLLNLHCGIPSSSFEYHGTEFNSILLNDTPPSDGSSKSKNVRGCGEEESSHVIRTFDELCREIRALKNLPLVVNSIHGVDSALRLTEALTPRQYQVKVNNKLDEDHILKPKVDHKSPIWCPVINALVQFETSGKWPEDLIAIQHIRAAFHIKIAECIRNQLRIPSVATPQWIDVFKNGYVFRLSVIHYREMVLCKESTETGRLKAEHDLAAKKLELQIVKKPHHNSLIHGLNGRYRGYALTCRLAKRWISSHMLYNHFAEELIELITAYLFLSPAPLETPNSHFTGFLRFLNHMAKFDWQSQPLIVNLNDEIASNDIEGILENFSTNRDHLPAMIVATPYDRDGITWTKPNPNTQILRRVAMLAQAALTFVENRQFDFTKESITQLFRPSIKDYDVVIELDKKHVPKHSFVTQGTSSSLVKLCSSLTNGVSNTTLPVVDFDPTKYFLKQLEEAFSEVAMFFYDAYGGLKIGIVWKRNSLSPQPFKILNSKYKMYEEIVEKKTPKKKKKNEKISLVEKRNVVPNLPAIIDDFSIIGRGLVKSVTTLKQVT